MSESDVLIAEHSVKIREHERRLNTYNGSLERMADSVDQLIVQHAEWRATVKTWGTVFGILLGIVGPVVSALAVYLFTRA